MTTNRLPGLNSFSQNMDLDLSGYKNQTIKISLKTVIENYDTFERLYISGIFLYFEISECPMYSDERHRVKTTIF